MISEVSGNKNLWDVRLFEQLFINHSSIKMENRNETCEKWGKHINKPHI